MKKFLLGSALAALGLVAFVASGEIGVRVQNALAQNTACNVDNCQEQGGSRWSVAGSLDVLSGGDLDIESGATFKVAGVAVTPTVEVVAATNVITAAESGATFFLNDATEFVSTLPAPAAGLRYTFVITGAPASASYTVVTNASANIMTVILTAGGIDDASDVATARDVVTFVDAQSVAGDWMECISDGTNWFCRGSAAVAAGITTGQT